MASSLPLAAARRKRSMASSFCPQNQRATPKAFWARSSLRTVCNRRSASRWQSMQSVVSRLAGLVDDLGGLVGHVVVEDADVTGVTLVAEDVFLDILPGAASVHATQASARGCWHRSCCR